MDDEIIHVFKLGGSLLDLPDLPERLFRFLQESPVRRQLLIVGGGRAADVVRQYDACYRLDKTVSHWLAVRAMQLNTDLLASFLSNCQVVSGNTECQVAWRAGVLALADPFAWLQNEHECGITIPHRWTFSSDSIAAHIASRVGARRLTLLKSTTAPRGCNMKTAVALGLADEEFSAAAASLGSIRLVNLRAQPPTDCALR